MGDINGVIRKKLGPIFIIGNTYDVAFMNEWCYIMHNVIIEILKKIISKK